MFGRLAVEAGVLSEKNRAQLLALQARQQPKLGEILVEMGVMSAGERDALLQEYSQLMAPGG